MLLACARWPIHSDGHHVDTLVFNANRTAATLRFGGRGSIVAIVVVVVVFVIVVVVPVVLVFAVVVVVDVVV